MDFSFSPGEKELYARMRALGEELSLLPSEERLSALARAGVLGLALPAELGGGAYSLLATAHAFEALGYSLDDGGVLLAAGAHLFGVGLLVLKVGSEAQKNHWLPKLARGEVLATVAASEHSSGSDIAKMEAVAENIGECTAFRLWGHKRYVTLAHEAGLYLVIARDGKEGRGLTALLLPRETAGIVVLPKYKTLGLAGAGLAELRFEGCELSGEALLGKAGAGFFVFQMAMTFERALILAFRVGAMERVLQHCIRFARTRELGGVAISKYQAISQRIARMKLRLETSRLLLYRSAWILDQQHERGQADAALTKWHLSESALESALDALKIRGGEGFLEESGLGAGVDDALGGWIHSGTGDVLANIVAKWLGL